MDSWDPGDVDLMGALAGNDAALAFLVKHLTPVIQARAGYILLQAGRQASLRQSVEDLTQEVLLTLFRDDARVLRAFDPRRGDLESYVAGITRNRSLKILGTDRRNPKAERSVDDAELERGSREPGPEHRFASRECLLLVLKRFRRELSPLGWDVFNLLYLDEKTPEEVSQQMDMSLDAVYAWASRLRKKVRRLLEELDCLSEDPESNLA